MSEHVIVDSRDGSRTEFKNKALMMAYLAHHADIVRSLTLWEPYSYAVKIPHYGATDKEDTPNDYCV